MLRFGTYLKKRDVASPTGNDNNDIRIIERCKAGDRKAAGLLYSSHRERLLAVCRRYVADPVVCEDLLHDAFLIILASLHRLRDVGKAEAWMAAIMRNCALKYVRRQNTMATLPLENMPDEHAVFEDKLQWLGEEDWAEILARLPEGYRNVFRMAVFEGMSHKEISDELGIEPHTSSSQLFKAKRMIRRMLRQYRMWLVLLCFLISVGGWLWLRKDGSETDADVWISLTEGDAVLSDEVSGTLRQSGHIAGKKANPSVPLRLVARVESCTESPADTLKKDDAFQTDTATVATEEDSIPYNQYCPK